MSLHFLKKKDIGTSWTPLEVPTSQKTEIRLNAGDHRDQYELRFQNLTSANLAHVRFLSRFKAVGETSPWYEEVTWWSLSESDGSKPYRFRWTDGTEYRVEAKAESGLVTVSAHLYPMPDEDE